jgi:hypothetical protein
MLIFGNKNLLNKIDAPSKSTANSAYDNTIMNKGVELTINCRHIDEFEVISSFTAL